MRASTASVLVSGARDGWLRWTTWRASRLRAVRPHPSGARRAMAWREAVNAAVERLPARQREVFVLCHLGDHTPRDVSMMTGMRESTVRVHLFRAVHKLRAALGAWRDLR